MKAIFTVVTRSYLHFAITLLNSVRSNSPTVAIFCLVVDADPTPVPELAAVSDILYLSDLPIADVREFCFRYDVVELCTATKPFVFSYLFDAGFDSVAYLDPDIYVYSPLDEVDALIESGISIVLTPHLVSPTTDDKLPGELEIRRTGAYNLGFCAVSATRSGRHFVLWWMAKLAKNCLVDLDRGVFVDQSWIDLVPGLFEGVAILRDPGYNVAYWNLAQRPLALNELGIATVKGHALRFFHFSGIDPLDNGVFSKYQNRFTGDGEGDVAKIFSAYRSQLIENGALRFKKLPYKYDLFSNGEKIPSALRRAFVSLPALREEFGADPFARANLLRTFVNERSIDGLAPSLTMMAIWHNVRDLPIRFPLNSCGNIVEFYGWMAVEGHKFVAHDLVDWHNDVLAKWQQTRIRQIGGTQNRAPDLSVRADLLAEQLFLRFLSRTPEHEARQAYSALCMTLRGYFKAWTIIAFSSESRSKSNLMRRLYGGARDAIQVCRHITLVP
jgi:hypothetical protein